MPTPHEQRVELANEIQRRIAVMLVWGAAFVAALMVGWGVYDVAVGNTRGAVYAFVTAAVFAALGYLAWRGSHPAPSHPGAAGRPPS
ncbi:MAG: hypothetical protein KDC33_03640 [Thermoleophilia bacterium]|nr:hypothetical protein [Thermoleophilia bacterium]